MLNRDLINRILSGMPEIRSAGNQIFEGDGYDAIMDILKSLRSVEFPVIVLESLWVMGQLGRNEDEAALYRDMFCLCKEVLARMLAAKSSGEPDLQGWYHDYISYMKRYGGPNARGYELVITFKDDISLHNG